MPFTLKDVVPWGRSMDEYVAMFDLSPYDLKSQIVSCADGPADFNAEMTALGRSVVSLDPVYQFSGREIRRRIDETFQIMMQQLSENLDDYLWDKIPSAEALGQLRMKSMERFLDDFNKGLESGRYLAEELPCLSFQDRMFDLSLCSHFLFLYSDQLSSEFHLQAIDEMLRVAREVRVFPIITMDRQKSPHLEAVCRHIRKAGRNYAIKTVAYEFQRGGNQMLRVW